MDVLVSIATKIAESVVVPIGRQFGYLFKYTSNIKTFKESVENLENKRVEMQSRVTNARSNGEEIFQSVIKWLDDVNAFLVESNNFLNEDLKAADTKCIKGLCPNLWSRYQLSRKAEKKMKDKEDLAKRNIFTLISEYVQQPPIEFATVEDSMAFKSREEILDKIWASLKGEHVRMIGICGMAGVGKTTLVTQICKLANSLSLFDVILMVVVSQNPNYLDIQDRFAEIIGLRKFDEKTKEGRASRLHGVLETKLKDGKKILVILDDVWEKLNMSDLGIPFSNDDSKSEKSCKIVVTSRDENVCRQMGSLAIYSVEQLHQDEAWSLFEKIVGHDTLNSIDRRPIASKIIEACGGLPLAINIIASALRNNDSLDCWKDAIGKIKRGEVFTTLELSYKYLKKEPDAQELFLLCSLFRQDVDIPIYDLLIHGLGWGLFQDTTTLDSTFVRIHALVAYLKSSSLLLDGANKKCVKMHDVVQEFVLSVASKDRHMFHVETGSNLDNLESNGSLKLCTSISLQIKDADSFPSKLDLPELKLLKLESCFEGPPLVLPYDIFTPLQKLKVLSMYGLQIMSLPPSFKYFQELHALSFDSCKISDILGIGELKNLLFLCFRGCNIKALPKEIGKLTKLKLLDLSKCKKLTIIPSNVIRSLSRLEGLSIDYFREWEVPSEDNGNNRASLQELESLSCLVSLKVHIPVTTLWPEDLLLKNLRRFKISIGGQFEEVELLSSSSKILKLNHVTSRPLIKGVDVLLQKAEVIFMENMNGFQNGLYDLDLKFLELKCLHIKKFGEMKYVADATIARCEVFPRLEILEISSLHNLQEISHGNLLGRSFRELQELRLDTLPQLMYIWKSPAETAPLCNLRILTVSGCLKLKSIFSQSMVRYLSQLLEMKVDDCEALEEIVDCENEPEVPDIVFQQLRILSLTKLPMLKSFLSLVNAWARDNHHAPRKQVSLFQNKVTFPKLEDLCLSKMDSLREIWTSPFQLKLSFPRLKELSMSHLPNLMHVWYMGSCETISFQSLSSITIDSCPTMKGVATIEENTTPMIEFPSLQTMVLKYLCNFNAFYTERSTLLDEKVVVPNLKELSLCGLTKLRHVWENLDQHRTHLSFQQLRQLEILCCDNLRDVLSASTTGSLLQQQVESTFSCDRTKTIDAGNDQEERNNKTMIVFPSLEVLNLDQLPNLTSFFTGSGIVFDEKVAFPALEKLEVAHLDNIRGLWCSQVPLQSFGGLKQLNVSDCNKLVHVVPSHLVQQLLNTVEHILVHHCDLLEELFELQELAVDERKPTPTFHRLRSLDLSWNPKLEYLFDEKVSFPTLEKLLISGMEGLIEISPLQLPPGSFHQLKIIYVHKCDKLRSIFPSNLFQNMWSLRALTVDSCKTVKEIIGDVAGGLGHTKVIMPHLEYIKLWSLPMLKSFCHNRCDFRCPSLTTVDMRSCQEMETFTYGNLKTPMLKSTYVDSYKQYENDLNSTVRYAYQEHQKGEKSNDGDKNDGDNDGSMTMTTMNDSN